MTNKSGWIGVDLDATLARYEGWKGSHHIGDPIPAMLERVKAWVEAGRTVKIFTARVHGHGQPLIGGGQEDALGPIQEWCMKHIGKELEITNVKDFGMIELWDDRAVQVIPNTGITAAQYCVATERERDQWRECAEELVAACTLHYGGDDSEDRDKSAEPFLRIMRVVERINSLGKQSTETPPDRNTDPDSSLVTRHSSLP